MVEILLNFILGDLAGSRGVGIGTWPGRDGFGELSPHIYFEYSWYLLLVPDLLNFRLEKYIL